MHWIPKLTYTIYTYFDNHTDRLADIFFSFFQNSSVLWRCESIKRYLSFTEKNKGSLVHGVNFKWIWQRLPPPEHSLHLTWLWYWINQRSFILSQILHRSQASLTVDLWTSDLMFYPQDTTTSVLQTTLCLAKLKIIKKKKMKLENIFIIFPN